MGTWSAHHLFQEASKKIDSNTAVLMQRYANHLRIQRLPVIFSLRHLGEITGLESLVSGIILE